MFARVNLLGAPFSCYTYSLPPAFPAEFWQTGLRVLVPVGRMLRAGCIQALAGESGLAPDIKCRDVVFPLETEPLLKPDIVLLASDLAARQGITPGSVLGHVLPAGLRRSDAKVVWNWQGAKRTLTGRALASLSHEEYGALAQSLLSGGAIIAESGRNSAESEIYSVAVDPPWPLRPAAARQIEVMDYLYDHGSASRALLTKMLGSQVAEPLRRLLALGLVRLELFEEEEPAALLPPPEPEFALNDEQRAALDELLAAFALESAQTRLVYGVTGSGKTAVYLELMRACIASGKSCLLLAPEVALAHKLHQDMENALGDVPHFLYHGYQHPAKRERLFRAVSAQKMPCVVVGTRSALFLPLARPGCIILDEEHDSSYKQDENLPYHAKEVAWFRARQASGLLVLGSATPDIRSFHAARSGILPAVVMKRRVSGNILPPVEMVELDSRAGFAATPGVRGLLAPVCEQALENCLKRGEQAVILLNRRGYAPQIYCLSCGHTLRCPHCQIGMAFHKGIGRLVCHYCGHNLLWPAPCPECGGANYMAIGEGTERIAERLEALAGQRILRLDRDSARSAGRIDEILTGFRAGESPFLVGTQMLSKGHHFPNVTLVVVADGDIGLNLPDYRAAERTFQLLVQSAGRAGRGCKPGRALIQTRNPDHYCWRHIVNYDYEGFYQEELARRQKYNYPPFTRLALLRFSWPAVDDDAAQAAKQLGQDLKKEAKTKNLIFLGPAPAPIAMIKGRKRMQCLIKGGAWQPMRELWFMAQKHSALKKVRIALDLDPVNML